MKQIGLILKNTREDLDLTQIDVMRHTGINNKTLSGYENGVSEPDLETFAKLMQLYKLSADSVLGIRVKENALSLQENQLLQSFRALSPQQQGDLLVMLRALSGK